MSDPLALARRLLAEARPAPGESVEIFALDAESRRIEVARGGIENAETSRSLGVAVRVLVDHRQGFAYRADVRGPELAAAVAEARELARRAEPDPARVLPAPGAPAPSAPDEDVPDAAGLTELARRVERAALAADSRVRTAHQAAAHAETRRLALASTQGMDLAWTQAEVALSVSAVAEAGGDSQIGDEVRIARSWRALDPEAIGRAAGGKAAGLLGASALPTQARTLLIPPALAAALLEAALPAWSAEAVSRGRSFLAGQAGRRVGAACLDLTDDGTLADAVGAAPVDDEGAPTRRTDLLRGGLLGDWLHNTETARRAGCGSTGNARRPGLLAPPSVGPSHVILRPGDLSRAELLARAEGGLWLADLLGLHTLDPVSGHFSLGASGWLVTGGAPGRPVRGVTVAGSLTGLLTRVEAVGADLEAHGRFSAPTILVRDIMVAGE